MCNITVRASLVGLIFFVWFTDSHGYRCRMGIDLSCLAAFVAYPLLRTILEYCSNQFRFPVNVSHNYVVRYGRFLFFGSLSGLSETAPGYWTRNTSRQFALHTDSRLAYTALSKFEVARKLYLIE